MSASYTSILWNKHKRQYDIGLSIAVLSFLALFFVFNTLYHPSITLETIIIRAFGWLAILMLHIILIIGPLARLNSKFSIILYNRRHLGVSMFLIACVHGIFNIMQFHSLGNLSAIKSIFLSNLRYDSITYFPFQTLGFIGLIILGLMATSSHDFWLKNLGVRVWKALHMMVYLAYGLLILHIVLGALQNETNPIIFGIVAFGFLTISGLHIISALKERKIDSEAIHNKEGFAFVCKVSDIKEDRASMITVSGERVAIFKYNNKLSAVNNVCRHQGGPLGEGKVIDGCITCPWHGYQYYPKNGQSPPPFTEKVETYEIRLEGEDIWVNINPNEPGTEVKPIDISSI